MNVLADFEVVCVTRPKRAELRLSYVVSWTKGVTDTDGGGIVNSGEFEGRVSG